MRLSLRAEVRLLAPAPYPDMPAMPRMRRLACISVDLLHTVDPQYGLAFGLLGTGLRISPCLGDASMERMV
jgi:hypothetical protein